MFGEVEDDDVICLLELLIQLPLAPFSFDLRRTGHFESAGEEGEKRGGRREKKERWTGALMDNAMGYQESGEGTRQWYNPLHRIPRSTDDLTKKRRSHFGLHDQYRTGHVAQPTMYISQFQESNPGRSSCARSPTSGFPGHSSRYGRSRRSDLVPRMEMRVRDRSVAGDLVNPMEG